MAALRATGNLGYTRSAAGANHNFPPMAGRCGCRRTKRESTRLKSVAGQFGHTLRIIRNIIADVGVSIQSIAVWQSGHLAHYRFTSSPARIIVQINEHYPALIPATRNTRHQIMLIHGVPKLQRARWYSWHAGITR